jgi:hypothetical protein
MGRRRTRDVFALGRAWEHCRDGKPKAFCIDNYEFVHQSSAAGAHLSECCTFFRGKPMCNTAGGAEFEPPEKAAPTPMLALLARRRKLPPKQRAVVILYYLEEIDIPEIAASCI